MVFSSTIFLFLFLPLILFLHFFIKQKFYNFLLLLASLFFYAWGEPTYILLILFSILMNYLFGLAIHTKRATKKVAKALIILTVSFNLILLGFFKYANFLVDNINILFILCDLKQISIEPVTLPIGISFFTFQALSYVIDVYREETNVQKNILKLALYVSFFPQLIAGPIVRYHDIANQIDKRNITLYKVFYGTKRFIIGLGKKVIIANTVGSLADQIFALSPEVIAPEIAWLGSICYSLQIYFDFSGYSDMAIGLGSIFGFHYLENFNYPYISKNIKEFWRRWHISLSSWFRDYLYIPLGGNRISTVRTYINLLIVFILCGFWHGSSWNFIIWGLFHGFFLVLERTKFGVFLSKAWNPLQHIYTLFIVSVAWVFFRSENLPYALHYLKAMFYLNNTILSNKSVFYYLTGDKIIIIIIGLLVSTPVIKKFTVHLKKIKVIHAVPINEITLTIIFLVSIMYLVSSDYNPFIYFRF